MKLTEDQYELIDAYLTNELSVADRLSLEKDIQANSELRAEISLQRELRMGLQGLGIKKALERAKKQYETTVSVSADNDTELIVRPLLTWRYWAAAASLILVMGIGYYAYQQSRSQNADLAYAETFAPDPANELIKGFPSTANPAVRQQFLDALTNYKVGKYDQVINQLTALPNDEKTVYYKNYFLGLSYLADKQPSAAIPLLLEAKKTSSIRLRQKAEWFLALAYVKNKEKEKALPTLKRISTDKANPFNALAKQVLKKLN